jgi:hypothetical protein
MKKLINDFKTEMTLSLNRLRYLVQRRGTVGNHETIDSWIRDTTAIAADRRIWAPQHFGAHDNDVEDLRQLTNNLLESERRVNPDDVGQFIEELIQAHPQKHVAIMATMHRISRKALEGNLQRKLREHASSLDEIAISLRLVLEADQANFTTIDRTEVRWANALLSLSTASPEDVCGRLESFSDLLTANEPAFQILDMSKATRIQHEACRQFSLFVEELLRESLLQKAYTACSWLSRLDPTSRFALILYKECPDWQKWAVWRPNRTRIQRWVTLNAEQRKIVSDILCLEGPDILTGAESTLMKSVSLHSVSSSEIHHGSLIIKVPDSEEPSRTFERILGILDAILEQDLRSLSVFIKTFLGNTIASEELQIFDAALATKDPSISTSLLQIINKTNGPPAAGLLQLISALNKLDEKGDRLRELVTPMILEAIPKFLEPPQADFQEYVQNGMIIENVGIHLANRLYRLKDAAWLVPRLNGSTREILHHLTAPGILEAALCLYDMLQPSSGRQTTGLAATLKAYCLGQLTGQDEISEEEKVFVEEMLRIRTLSRNLDHRKAALIIAQASHIPVKIRRDCLASLTSIPEKLIESVYEMENTERACFRITRAITQASDDKAARPVNGCWIDLLEALIHSQGADLAERMCSSLTVKQWFQWQEGLRKIFLIGTGRKRLSTPLLQRSALLWSERLSKDFSRELELVQEATKGPQIRYILLQQGDIVTTGQLLPAMKLASNGSKIPRSVIVGILSNLRPNCRNTKSIIEALSRLTFMSTTGIAVSERLVEALARNGRQNVSDILATIPQASELLESDVRALRSIGTVYRQD